MRKGAAGAHCGLGYVEPSESEEATSSGSIVLAGAEARHQWAMRKATHRSKHSPAPGKAGPRHEAQFLLVTEEPEGGERRARSHDQWFRAVCVGAQDALRSEATRCPE